MSRTIEPSTSLEAAPQSAHAIDRKCAVVLTTAAIALTLLNYIFVSEGVAMVPGALHWLGAEAQAARLQNIITAPANRELAGLSYWAIGRVISYVVVPMVVIRFVLREPLGKYGLKVRGCLRSAWIYLLMLGVMLPVVYFFSTTMSFQQTYPFYDLRVGESLWPRFWVWQCLYALQFVSLEFFFRGFLLHGTKHRFGSAAIFVMMVPYCMIHFAKPMPEAMGAIGAGLVLGYMSLRTCSIWLGAALHIAVAMSMDMLALMHKGVL